VSSRQLCRDRHLEGQHQQPDKQCAEAEPDNEERRNDQFGEYQHDATDDPLPPFGIHVFSLRGRVFRVCRAGSRQFLILGFSGCRGNCIGVTRI
jgi:hypothetical protein